MMTFHHRLLSLLLLPPLLLIPFIGCSQSEAPGSLISAVEGDVQIRRAGTTDWTKAELRVTLSGMDVVKTGADSSGSITFFDGSVIDLNPDTQVEIRELVRGKTTSIRLKQEIGETLSRVKKLVDPASRYEIETPVAIAAVRGSQMRVTVGPDGTTTVQNVEGKISVTAQGVEVTIPEGGASTIKPGEPPGPTSYSAVGAFSMDNGNPNGNWAYGWMPTDFSRFNTHVSHEFTVFGNSATRNSFSWYTGLGVDRTPCLWINKGVLAYGVPTGWLSLHPGPGREPSVMRWTPPTAGSIRILGEFLPGDRGSMTVAIRHNGREIWSATDSGKFDLLADAAVGDTFDLMVYGGYNYGNTPVSVIFSYVD
jgi:hypothetical protein